MKRRGFLVLILTSSALPLAQAQSNATIRRVGWLTGGSPRTHAKLLEAFREGLREHGWVEGTNIAIEVRWAEGDNTRLPALAAELVRRKPDVIVTAATTVHLAVKKETSTIPHVLITGTDPVEAGLVTSLSRPGGNITGLSGFFDATAVKMLEFAAALIPRGARVVVLVDVNSPFSRGKYRDEVERTAKAVGLRADFTEVTALDDVTRAFTVLAKSPPAALVVLPSPMFFFLARDMPKNAAPLNVPVIYPFEESVEAGGLIGYAAPLAGNYRRAAWYVDRILKGAKPGELPIEQPMRLALAINLKTAKAQGISFPQAILLRADRVIE